MQPGLYGGFKSPRNTLIRSGADIARLLDALEAAGMLYLAAGFAHYQAYGPWRDKFNLPSNEIGAAIRKRMRSTFDERSGIARHKLVENRVLTWWVTGAECRSAITLWERAGVPLLDGEDTPVFLRACAEADCDGFFAYSDAPGIP